MTGLMLLQPPVTSRFALQNLPLTPGTFSW